MLRAGTIKAGNILLFLAPACTDCFYQCLTTECEKRPQVSDARAGLQTERAY